MNSGKKVLIKIPVNVSVFYCKITQFLLIKGPLGTKFIKIDVKLIINKNQGLIELKNFILTYEYKLKQKYLLSYINHLKKILKNCFFEVSVFLFKKLKFIGLGYRFFLIDKKLNLLQLKLGYSHNVFFKVPKNIELNFYKNTVLYFKSNNYYNLNKILSKIKLNKKLDFYKGKGILYENEKIKLKKGKKI